MRKKKKQYQFEINEQIEGMKIIDRWHGRDCNFYDVLILRDHGTWTYDENELRKIENGLDPYH